MQEINELSISAEQQVLGILLSTPKSFVQLGSKLEASDFVDEFHARIFSAMQDIRKGGGDATVLTVALALGITDQMQRNYLVGLDAAIANKYGFSEYVSRVKDYSTRRKINQIIREAEKSNLDLSINSAEIVGSTIKSLTHSTPSWLEDIGDIVDLVKIAGEDGQRKCFSTGMPRMDAVMGGGIYAGRMYGWGGRQKKGKSTVLLTLAYNLALQGHRVAYLTLEMDKIEVAERFLCRKADVYAGGALRGSSTPPDWVCRRISDAKGYFRENRNISIISAPRMSLTRLQSEMSAIGYGNKADVVIVDYLQLVSGRGKNESGADFYDTVAQTLAEMAKTHNYAVLTAVQLNRDGEVRGGDGLLNACDMAFMIDSISTQGNDGTQDIAGWMDMIVTRYTPYCDIGSKEQPAYDMIGKGPYWEERKKPC